MGTTSERIVKNTLFLYIRMAVSIFTNIFTTRILLEALGASDYGLYNVVGGTIAMLGFVTASMSSATQRFINYVEGEHDIEKSKEVLNNALIIHYGIAAISVLIFVCAGFIFFNGVLNIPPGRESAAMAIYGCMIFSTTFSITVVPYDASINAHENMLFYSIVGIADVLFKLFIAISVIFIDNDKLILYGILMALESWLIRVITQQYCKHHYKECQNINLKKYYNRHRIKEMTSFAGWNLLNIASGMISLYGMNIVINHYFGTQVNAAQAVATQLSGVLMGVSMNMIKAITPAMVKKESGHQRTQMLELSYVGCKFSFLLFSFFSIPVIFYMNDILRLWLHNIPSWTNIFCIIMICSTLIEQMFVLLYQTIMAQGNIKNYNIARSIVNLTPIIISIAMMEYMAFPPYWVLLNWLIWKSVIGSLINLIYAKSNVGLSIRMFAKRVILTCSGCTVSIVLLNIAIKELQKYTNINFILLLIVTAIISLPIYYIIGMNKSEKETTIKLISKII